MDYIETRNLDYEAQISKLCKNLEVKKFNEYLLKTGLAIRTRLDYCSNLLMFLKSGQPIIVFLEQKMSRAKRSIIISCLKHFFRMKHKINNASTLPPELENLNLQPKRFKDSTKASKNRAVPSKFQIQQAISYSGALTGVLIAVLSSTGMRISEALSLKMCNLKFENGRVLINIENSKTLSGKRTLYMIDYLPILKGYLQGHPLKKLDNFYNSEALVFVRNDGKPLAQSSAWWKINAAFEKVGLKGVGCHSLRHARTTDLIRKGMDLMTITKLTGHKSLQMLQTYGHTTFEDAFKFENGSEEVKKVFCESCKCENEEGIDFCVRCGTPLNEVLLQNNDTQTQLDELKKMILAMSEKIVKNENVDIKILNVADNIIEEKLRKYEAKK
ncbi:MAG: site-specific integrase [Nanoarchaeota archaeon]|nr:site-specific integrase [Nanoarchaeota archaeon]MBU1854095.1 site-specific integrase [Nanoarchaeota archaeon]